MLKCAIEVSNIIIIIIIIIIITWLCNMVLNCSLVCSIWEYVTAFFARLQFTTVPLWCSYHYHHHRHHFCYYYLHHKDLYCIVWLIISFSWKNVLKDVIPCMVKIHCSWHFVPCFYLSCFPVEDIRQQSIEKKHLFSILNYTTTTIALSYYWNGFHYVFA